MVFVVFADFYDLVLNCCLLVVFSVFGVWLGDCRLRWVCFSDFPL